MSMWTHCTRAFALIGAVLFLGAALRAEKRCSAEVKLLLPPPTIQKVIASLIFAKPRSSQIYFFDTDARDLQRQGVIVRVRQGANDDLTVKVRVPEGSKQIDLSSLRAHFPCEINRTGAGEDTDYSVKRKYKTLEVPEMGLDIFKLLNPSQRKLLREAKVSIDWERTTRTVDVRSTNWETTTQRPFRELALELWEWPSGSILEVSAKVGPDERQSKYAELQRLLNRKSMSLSPSQGNKTSAVLETIAYPSSPPR